ncbi:MAG: Y-family DNA polymerase [Kiritimatiellae bacterium]|nr:Y-family DNA polymerase [Kiritimatiellia bacterium]
MIGLVDGNNFFVSCERVVDPKLNGKPVAVLSNNDGCCVSRSNEFKALGIGMGVPYYQLKDREYPKGDLFFRSSNYELYGDMSRRIIEVLRGMAADVMQYSIDEAFIRPPTPELGRLADYGGRIRSRILKWIGIPCGVGFASTKTLAKIANHIGKKLPEGVFVMPDEADGILAGLPAGEVWGVGRRLPAKLRAERIMTAKDLRDAPDDVLRSVGGVTLLRTALELRGVECHEDRDYAADPDSVSCSRSFGEKVGDAATLMEAIASFTAQAAVKLRRHGMLAAGCNVYAQVATPGLFERGGDWEGSFHGCTVAFPAPTDATNVMTEAIRRSIGALFVSGAKYRKAGVVLFGLEKAGAVHQTDLFRSEQRVASPLYRTIDAINARLGRGKVFSAAEGMRAPSWQMKRSKMSRRATTNWNELITVR